MKVYPAIDVRDGACVRLRQGDFGKTTVYSESPTRVATKLRAIGFERLHVIDLDGARTGDRSNDHVVAAIASTPGLAVQVGGGVRTTDDVTRLLALGVGRVIVGSAAVTDPALVAQWVERVGAGRIVIALDVRDDAVAISGWAEQTDRSVFDVMGEMIDIGINAFIVTDISRDGMLVGSNTELYRRLLDRFESVDLIASGGVGSLADLDAVANSGVTGVIVGRAIYDGTIDPTELRAWEVRSPV